MRVIELTQGRVAIVDDEDFAELAQYRWHYSSSTGYARRCVRGTRKVVYMHRSILMPRDGMKTDHRNGEKLDNRRINLREASAAQNIHHGEFAKLN